MGDERSDWLETTLQPLKTQHHDHAWSSAGDVQRRGARLHRRRLAAVSGAGGLALAAALVVGVSSFSTGSGGPTRTALPGHVSAVAGPDGSVHLVTDVKGDANHVSTLDDSAVSAAEEEFSLQLTRSELAQEPGSNVLLSPMSADIDLAMLELGSGGATARQVAAALSSSGLSSGAQAEGWSGIVRELMTAESSGELHLANSIWVDKDITVQPQFLRAAAATFGDDTYQVDFAKSSAIDAINSWVDQQTAGRITKLYGPKDLSAATEVVLANALHFHAAWQPQLWHPVVRVGSFFTSAATRVSVPMLSDTPEGPVLAAETPAYDAVQLPYTNGRFAALLVEPTGSLSAFLHTMSSGSLSSLVASMRGVGVDLTMPELHLAARETLDSSLSAMGMAQAFAEADFTPMLGASGAVNQAVGSVQQAASLDVNQWGTDAAAATGVNAIASAGTVAALTISFNHPYLFFIRDTKTGTILFSSVVNNPAVS